MRTPHGAATTGSSGPSHHSLTHATATRWITNNIPATSRNAIDHQCGQPAAALIIGGTIGALAGTTALLIQAARWAIRH